MKEPVNGGRGDVQSLSGLASIEEATSDWGLSRRHPSILPYLNADVQETSACPLNASHVLAGPDADGVRDEHGVGLGDFIDALAGVVGGEVAGVESAERACTGASASYLSLPLVAQSWPKRPENRSASGCAMRPPTAPDVSP